MYYEYMTTQYVVRFFYPFVYCEKEKDKANKRILRSLSFHNNGLVKPSCRTVALYGPCFF